MRTAVFSAFVEPVNGPTRGAPYRTAPAKEPYKALAPWLPQMPTLQAAAQRSEHDYHWKLKGSDKAALEQYWVLFKETYADEILWPSDDPTLPDDYGSIATNWSGNHKYCHFSIWFTTKPGKPSFWNY